jgi:magnesium transporter
MTDEKVKEKFRSVKSWGVSWYNFYQPTSDEVDFLKKKFSFLHHLDLETCLATKTQRPKIEINPRYTFFVLHFPYLNKKSEDIKVAELDVFLTEKVLITLSHEGFPFINSTFASAAASTKKADNLLAQGPEGLLFKLIRRYITRLSSLLDEIGLKVDEIDDKLFAGEERKLVGQIFQLRRDIIVLKTSIAPHIGIFTKLEQSANPENKMAEYWGSVTDNLGRLADRVENYRELIVGLSSTLESYLTYRTNEIIKILTIFSVILLPLTFITGAYGMNLANLPLASHPASFWLIALGMIVLVGAMIFFFRKKKWL